MTVGVATAVREKAATDLHVTTVAAPVVPLARFIEFAPEADSVLWAPSDGYPSCGAGIAAEVGATGPERFAWLEQRARELFSRTIERRVDDVAAPPVRLFGGFAFAPGATRAEPWQDFGDARFVLPTWSYGHCDGGAWLRLISDDHASAQRDIADMVAKLNQAGATTANADDATGFTPARVATEVSSEDWRNLIAAIQTAIADGKCQKVVAAHCKTIDLARDIDHRQVFARLDARYSDCHRFSLSFGDAHFVGATPERLVRRDGCAIVTEALAGSIAASEDAATLLASEKDRSEQQMVVNTIAAVLEPLCRELRIPQAPAIRQLRHVLHLETQIRGILHRPQHVVELVRALHPTPAVGGVPTDIAMSWIDAAEPTPRGWYAAPVGWFDAEGDGEFVVAIRSALLQGRRAHVYAGAGIVRDSQADAELEETRIKQKALLGALGVGV